MSVKIAILDCKALGDDLSMKDFEKLGELSTYRDLSGDELYETVKDLDVIITNKVKIDKKLIDSAEKLKMVAITATGYNNVDLDYAKEKGISVYNVAGYSSKSVSQHTLAMALSLICRFGEMDRYIKSGEYSRSQNMTKLDNPIRQLGDMQWGIIGMGDIGKEVAKLAKAFGTTVKYYSPRKSTDEYERLELDELLKTSDIVSIHCPLNKETDNLIDYDKFKLMKKDAIIINVARGGIINEEDLKKAISEDLIFAAGLDVFEHEPIKADSPLLEIDTDRILMTPHTAWASVEARTKLINEVYMNVESFLNNGDRKPL